MLALANHEKSVIICWDTEDTKNEKDKKRNGMRKFTCHLLRNSGVCH